MSKTTILTFLVKVKISGKTPKDIRSAISCIKEDMRVYGSCGGDRSFDYSYKSVKLEKPYEA